MKRSIKVYSHYDKEVGDFESMTLYFVTIYSLFSLAFVNFIVLCYFGLPIYSWNDHLLEYYIHISGWGCSLSQLFILVSVAYSAISFLNMVFIYRHSSFRWVQRVCVIIPIVLSISFACAVNSNFCRMYQLDIADLVVRENEEILKEGWISDEHAADLNESIKNTKTRIQKVKVQIKRF